MHISSGVIIMIIVSHNIHHMIGEHTLNTANYVGKPLNLNYFEIFDIILQYEIYNCY